MVPKGNGGDTRMVPAAELMYLWWGGVGVGVVGGGGFFQLLNPDPSLISIWPKNFFLSENSVHFCSHGCIKMCENIFFSVMVRSGSERLRQLSWFSIHMERIIVGSVCESPSAQQLHTSREMLLWMGSDTRILSSRKSKNVSGLHIKFICMRFALFSVWIESVV